VKELEVIRRELQKNYPNYPKNCCPDAAQRIQDELGHEWVIGSYVIDGERHHHWWNENKEAVRYDITADQFDPTLPRVEVLSSGDERYDRYHPELRLREVKVVRAKNHK